MFSESTHEVMSSNLRMFDREDILYCIYDCDVLHKEVTEEAYQGVLSFNKKFRFLINDLRNIKKIPMETFKYIGKEDKDIYEFAAIITDNKFQKTIVNFYDALFSPKTRIKAFHDIESAENYIFNHKNLHTSN